MPFLTLLISPIGRWFTLGAILLVVCIGMVFKIQNDAVEKHKARQQVQEMKRLQNALDADERARRLLTNPDGVRADDGYRRD